MDNVDSEKSFPVTQGSLIAKKKELKSLDRGNHPNRAEGLTIEQEELLWQTGALGDNSPEVLINMLWYLTTKLLGFQASNKAYQMLWSNIEGKKLPDSDIYLEFNERLTKTRDGNKNPAKPFKPKMFRNQGNPEKCLVRL